MSKYQYCRCGQYMEYEEDDDYKFVRCPCCQKIIPLSMDLYNIRSDIYSHRKMWHTIEAISVAIILLCSVFLSGIYRWIIPFLAIFAVVFIAPNSETPESMTYAESEALKKLKRDNGKPILCDQENLKGIELAKGDPNKIKR